MNSGIYIIRNTLNDKVYIGQTSNLLKRWNSHKYLLRKNKHGNIHLQNSWNKNGESVFVYSVLENCAIDIINEREVYWINNFGGVECDKIFNLSAGGLGGGKRATEVCKKISAWQTGRKLSPSHVESLRRVATGRNHTENHKQYLSQLYKGRPLTEETKLKISESKKGIKFSEEVKFKLKNRGNVAVIQFSKLGELIKEFPSAKIAGEELGFWKSDITQCCMGKRKTVKGYIFKYK